MLYVNPLASNYPAPNVTAAQTAGARQEKALEEYEHLFLYQLLQDMRKTVPKGGLWKDGQEADYYNSMLDDHLAGQMAKSGQFGIAKQMAAQLALSEQKVSTADAGTTPIPLKAHAANKASQHPVEGFRINQAI